MPLLSQYDYRDLSPETVQAGLVAGTAMDLFGGDMIEAMRYSAVKNHAPLMQYLLSRLDFDTDMINIIHDEYTYVVRDNDKYYDLLATFGMEVAQQAVLFNSADVVKVLLDDPRFRLVNDDPGDDHSSLLDCLSTGYNCEPEVVPRPNHDPVLRTLFAHPRIMEYMPPAAAENIMHVICTDYNFGALQIAEEVLEPELIQQLLGQRNDEDEIPVQLLWRVVKNHIWEESDDVIPEPYFSQDLVPMVRRMLELDPASRTCEVEGLANAAAMMAQYAERFGTEDVVWLAELLAHQMPEI